MQRNDGLPRIAHLEQHEALCAEDAGVLPTLPEHLVEGGQGVRELAGAAQRVAQVGAGGQPGAGVRADLGGEREREAEQRDGVVQAVLVVEDDAELVEQQRVRLAQLVRRVEVLVRQRHVVQLQVLHPQEELRQVRALEEPRRRRVGRDGLVVLAFGGEGVREADPGGAEVRVHH